MKEAKKHVDVGKLAEQVAAKYVKDFTTALKKANLVDEDQLQDMVYDIVDWGKVSKAAEKKITDAVVKAFK